MPTLLITGANRGIGLEFARQHAADGWEVIAAVRQSSPELDALGVRIESLDMRDLDAVAGFGERIGRLDLMIANAGTWIPEVVEDAQDGRAWAEMMVANCIGPYMLAKSVLPLLAPARGKAMALTSGLSSIGDNRSGGYVPYRTSKAALNMAWRSLAIGARKLGVVIAVLDPGWVRTRMGGANAPTPPEQAVAEMRRVIEHLGPEQSGGFYKRDGTPEPW